MTLLGSVKKLHLIITLIAGLSQVWCMSQDQLAHFRLETEGLFYHGFKNYMKNAFPEDELRPLNCSPLTRDDANPHRVELNDPLGNYSLTLVDSLTTLGVLASGTTSDARRARALRYFKRGVEDLIALYGDGSDGIEGQGWRSRGFDLDSKVSVFETVIRGIGGLLSAHLFAVGELPISQYNVSQLAVKSGPGRSGIRWSESFVYDGQLLRLAHDLGRRLLPAFTTASGIPYPRINLRYGIPFYANSPASCPDLSNARCSKAQCPGNAHSPEVTETSSAGAGTLILEFTVLSRLTGDPVFEEVAKRAFWSLWDRRSKINLVGSSINAETGFWTSPFTGLGAGVDSFFEYAFKAYVLLSGTKPPKKEAPKDVATAPFRPPPLHAEHHDPLSFLNVWQQSWDSIQRHLYRGKTQTFPHYVQADLFNGAPRGLWLDSLSAFFPGLLALAGDIAAAIESHLLFTALWTRYSAIPERWSLTTAGVEGGLGWWLGRPEFIESTYHIYRATQDPWFLHVGEMTLKDIKRMCWTSCGLSGLQDVRTGEKNNRMESFFLGETAKYLFLLFDPDHPFNHLDAPFVFSTEGHPLILPRIPHKTNVENDTMKMSKTSDMVERLPTCDRYPQSLPLSLSHTAARPDLFHAADLARLDLAKDVQWSEFGPLGLGQEDTNLLARGLSPSNRTFYPWTLPLSLIPPNGMSSTMRTSAVFDVYFPSTSKKAFPTPMIQRIQSGLLIGNMAGLRLGLIQDVPVIIQQAEADIYRVNTINGLPLGRDERVLIEKSVLAAVVEPHDPGFSRVEDALLADLVIDLPSKSSPTRVISPSKGRSDGNLTKAPLPTMFQLGQGNDAEVSKQISEAIRALAEAQKAPSHSASSSSAEASPPVARRRTTIAAIMADGAGSAFLPDIPDATLSADPAQQYPLPWHRVYSGDENCESILPVDIPATHSVIVLRRGGCSFADKLANIPDFLHSANSLQLVVIVSFDEVDQTGDENTLTRPLIDEPQRTANGKLRKYPIPLIMVGGGQTVYDNLKSASAIGIKRRYMVHANGIEVQNIIIL